MDMNIISIHHMKKLLSLLLFSLPLLQVMSDNKMTSEQARLVGDGTTLNTERFQAAINQLSKKGGGVLLLKPGQYVTGTIEMKDNVELRLERGAEILGSTNPADYVDVTKTGAERLQPTSYLSLALIEANGARNIAITGEGVIDARGREVALAIDSLHLTGIRKDPNYSVRLHRPREIFRPNLFSILRSKGVRVSGLRFRNAACWGLVFFKCEDLTISGIDVHNRAYWNNDGIDVVDCHRVEIANSHIDAADDGICLKSDDPADACDSVYVHDCRVESSASAVKFGTNSFGGFKNIHIARIKVADTFRSAIAIEGVDGGIIRNVLVEDIDAFNTGNAIFVRLGKRHGNRTAVVDGITIRRLYCEVPSERPDAGYDLWGPIDDTMLNPVPSNITGIPGNKVRNVLISDVTIAYPGGASMGVRYIPLWNAKSVPERENSYPEFDMFGELPCYGFYVRHADGVTFRNVTLKLRKDDFRPAFLLDDASNVNFERVNYPVGKTAGQVYDTSKAQ